ncbi:MAG TPA: nucleoside hydrolase [Roseiflexaceae bacterium]|nr:nucleoside hydrolase [Roseiflexaceae bacterium]
MSIKVLLDTDIGSDIDDAVCLAYLLAQPECELMGITTVSGEPERRAMIASAQCQVAGRTIPIFPGAEAPLLGPQRQPHAPQADALVRWPHERTFARGQAIEFMRQTIRQNPGEVTLLAIGPMTNVALLFASDPEIPMLLKSLVLMCGVFTNQLAGVGPCEWNAICDPHAAAMVYRTRVPIHRSIGLDVTCQVTMDANEVRSRFSPPLLKPVLDFAEVWFEVRPEITFHDPLAAATIFDDTLCGYTAGEVDVELSSERLAGLTHWAPGGAATHEIALQVDAARFFSHYFSMFRENNAS